MRNPNSREKKTANNNSSSIERKNYTMRKTTRNKTPCWNARAHTHTQAQCKHRPSISDLMSVYVLLFHVSVLCFSISSQLLSLMLILKLTHTHNTSTKSENWCINLIRLFFLSTDSSVLARCRAHSKSYECLRVYDFMCARVARVWMWEIGERATAATGESPYESKKKYRVSIPTALERMNDRTNWTRREKESICAFRWPCRWQLFSDSHFRMVACCTE